LKKTNDNIEAKLYKTIIHPKIEQEPFPSLNETTLSHTSHLWQNNFNHHETLSHLFPKRKQKDNLLHSNSNTPEHKNFSTTFVIPKLKVYREHPRTSIKLVPSSKNNSMEASRENLLNQKNDIKKKDKLSISYNLIELNKKKKQYQSFSLADKMSKDTSFQRLEKINEDYTPLGDSKSERASKRKKLVNMLKTKNFNLFKNGLTENLLS